MSVHCAPVRSLDVETLYRIMQLRVDVFVVEQTCAYPELDGRDLEPDARLLWATDEDSSTVLATARVLEEPDGSARIGRVATTPAQRGRGWGTRLMRAALSELAGRPVVLDSQTDKRSWYQQFGFIVDGEEFFEDGIAHVPMRRLP